MRRKNANELNISHQLLGSGRHELYPAIDFWPCQLSDFMNLNKGRGGIDLHENKTQVCEMDEKYCSMPQTNLDLWTF
jgi:hypothetical protein